MTRKHDPNEVSLAEILGMAASYEPEEKEPPLTRKQKREKRIQERVELRQKKPL